MKKNQEKQVQKTIEEKMTEAYLAIVKIIQNGSLQKSVIPKDLLTHWLNNRVVFTDKNNRNRVLLLRLHDVEVVKGIIEHFYPEVMEGHYNG